jgi:hypothetical protein
LFGLDFVLIIFFVELHGDAEQMIASSALFLVAWAGFWDTFRDHFVGATRPALGLSMESFVGRQVTLLSITAPIKCHFVFCPRSKICRGMFYHYILRCLHQISTSISDTNIMSRKYDHLNAFRYFNIVDNYWLSVHGDQYFPPQHR